MDILWFRLPHLPEDPQDDAGRVRSGFANGRVLAVFDRFDYRQVGYVFPKGTYQDVRAGGLEALRNSIVAIEPSFAKHVCSLTIGISCPCCQWNRVVVPAGTSWGCC